MPGIVSDQIAFRVPKVKSACQKWYFTWRIPKMASDQSSGHLMTPLGEIRLPSLSTFSQSSSMPTSTSTSESQRNPLSLSPPHFVFLSHPEVAGSDFYLPSVDPWGAPRESGLGRPTRLNEAYQVGSRPLVEREASAGANEAESESTSLSDLLAGDVRRYLNLLEDPETLSAIDPHQSSGIPNLLEELLQARAALYMLRRRMRGLTEQRDDLVLQGQGLLHRAISTSLNNLANGEWNMSQPCPLATYRAEVFRFQGLLTRRRSKDGIEIIVTPDGDVLPDAPFAPAGVPACRCGTCDAIYGADPLARTRESSPERTITSKESDVKIER